MLFYIKKKKKKSSKITSFNLTVQDLEKASRAVSRLAHGLAPSEEAGRVTGGAGRVGDGRAGGWSAMGTGACSPRACADDAGSGSLLDSVLSTLLKKMTQ